MKTGINCKHCGEQIHVSKEDFELIEWGFCSMPDCCEDCFEMYENQIEIDWDSMEMSDADPGL